MLALPLTASRYIAITAVTLPERRAIAVGVVVRLVVPRRRPLRLRDGERACQRRSGPAATTPTTNTSRPRRKATDVAVSPGAGWSARTKPRAPSTPVTANVVAPPCRTPSITLANMWAPLPAWGVR